MCKNSSLNFKKWKRYCLLEVQMIVCILLKFIQGQKSLHTMDLLTSVIISIACCMYHSGIIIFVFVTSPLFTEFSETYILDFLHLFLFSWSTSWRQQRRWQQDCWMWNTVSWGINGITGQRTWQVRWSLPESMHHPHVHCCSGREREGGRRASFLPLSKSCAQSCPVAH